MRATLLSAILFCGCKDDRKTVAMDVFVCNPNSHTADYDCGDGFVCYSAVQAVGSSICVPSCDPNNATATCPDGACTRGGECLTRCSVEDSGACSAGGGILSCVRTDYSPRATLATDGVCLPVAFACDDEGKRPCESAVFNFCTSEISNGQVRSPGLLTSGSICVQGRCSADGVGCEPGSACIQKVLPASIASHAPDVCTPNCVQRTRADGTNVEECLPGFTCLTQAFPQSHAHVCVPGFAGWICSESLGCGTSDCVPWKELGDPFTGFDTCAPPCTNEDDCAPFQAGPAAPFNPNAFTTFTCEAGRCRSFQSLFFSISCLEPDTQCQQDSAGTCVINPVGSAPSPGSCTTLQMVGAINGSPALCERPCSDDGDCALLSSASHLTYGCSMGVCLPMVPYVVPCLRDSSCMPGLTCQPAVGAPAGAPSICTASCQSTSDCTSNPSLGHAFACLAGQCAPRTESGCPPPLPQPDVCLSGQLQGTLCVSPKGWACDSDSRCASGSCDPTGRCN